MPRFRLEIHVSATGTAVVEATNKEAAIAIAEAADGVDIDLFATNLDYDDAGFGFVTNVKVDSADEIQDEDDDSDSANATTPTSETSEQSANTNSSKDSSV